MKILKQSKINWHNPKIKMIIGAIACLLIVIIAIVLGVVLSNQESTKINKKEPLTQINEAINNQKQKQHKIVGDVAIIDKKGEIINKKVDITEINQTDKQKEILNNYLKNKEKLKGKPKKYNQNNTKPTINNKEQSDLNNNHINKTNDQNNHLSIKENEKKPLENKANNDKELTKSDDLNTKNDDENNKQDLTKLENNNKVVNNDQIEKNNEIINEEGPIKLKRFNIINAIAKNKKLYELLDFKYYFSNENNSNDIKFNEELFIKNMYKIIESAISSFQEFHNIMQYIKIDIKYKFDKDAKNIIVIVNWLFDNYNIKSETRYYEEFVLSIN
nr:DUF5452 domain-containing protein [Ureaplasma urealyticum]